MVADLTLPKVSWFEGSSKETWPRCAPGETDPGCESSISSLFSGVKAVRGFGTGAGEKDRGLGVGLGRELVLAGLLAGNGALFLGSSFTDALDLRNCGGDDEGASGRVILCWKDGDLGRGCAS